MLDMQSSDLIFINGEIRKDDWGRGKILSFERTFHFKESTKSPPLPHNEEMFNKHTYENHIAESRI